MGWVAVGGRRQAGWSGQERTQEYDKPIGPVGDVARLRLITIGPDVTAYTVQYEPWIEGVHRPAVRYDSAHGYPHMDVLGWDGRTITKVWMSPEPLNRALTTAEDHLDANWEAMSAITTTAAEAIERRSSELWRRFHQAIFADTSILDDIPNGVTLVLLPTDDPELAEAEVAKGLAVLRTGKDVYLRHVALADLPPLPVDTGGPIFERRTLYHPDGSVAAEEVPGPDGTWLPMEPLEER